MDSDYSSSISSLLPLDLAAVKRRNILILGTPGVGKSALTIRYKDDIFLEAYEPTLHNTITKMHQYNDSQVAIEINDIDGQTEYTIFSSHKFVYGINGYLLIYSIDSRDTFEKLKIINSKLDGLIGKKTPKVVIGNKADLEKKREVSRDEGKAFAQSIGCPFIETSAKNKVNIDLMISSLLTEINRNENVFDDKQLPCFGFFKFIIKNEQLFRKVILLMAIINAILCVMSIISEVLIILKDKEHILNRINDGIMILYSIASMIMSGIAVYACKSKRHKMFFVHSIGTMVGCIIIIFSFIFYTLLLSTIFTNNPDQAFYIDYMFYFVYVFLPIKLLFDVPSFVLSMIIKRRIME